MKTTMLMTVLGALTLACGGNGSGAGISLRMTLVGDDGDAAGPVVASDADGTSLEVESAFAIVRRIDFELPDGETCGAFPGQEDDDDGERSGSVSCDDDQLRVEGPWLFDLVTGESSPDLGVIAAPAGVYRRIDVRLQQDDSGDLDMPAGLADRTLIASGSFHGAGAERFELALDFTEDARFESQAGIDVAPGSLSQVMLGLAVARWFDALPIARCIEQGELAVSGGTVRIQDGSGGCSDVENELKDAIKDSGALR